MSKNLKRPAGFGLLFIAIIPLKLLIYGSGWWALLSVPLVALGIYLIKKAETGEEVSTPEYYDYVTEQIEKKVGEQKTHGTEL